MTSATFTSAECRAIAEQNLEQAESGEGNRKRLITAAEGWLFFASKLSEAETVFSTGEVVP